MLRQGGGVLLLGSGTVGGYAFSFERLGQDVAAKALEVLGCHSGAETAPAGLLTSEYVFDARALKRFGIGEHSLPPGSRVEFRELSPWDLYKEYIIAGFSLILIETSLIVALVFNRARRRQVEAQLVHLNESLEGMVQERTEALRKANVDLEQAKSDLERMNETLDHTSRVDSLTGLYNRRHMEERIHEEFSRFKREGAGFSIILADIDFFKRVNDAHGHDAGDSLLKGLSRDIAASLREYDIVARWGGEEFLVLLPATEAPEALAIAERIRENISQKVYAHHGAGLFATLTLGVCGVRPGDSLAALFRRADQALYQGKRAGRNRAVAAV